MNELSKAADSIDGGLMSEEPSVLAITGRSSSIKFALYRTIEPKLKKRKDYDHAKPSENTKGLQIEKP
jgi:hypothetical protein